MPTVLLIATDLESARHLRAAVFEPNIEVLLAGQAAEAKNVFVGNSLIDVICVDERFLDSDGLAILREARSRHPETTLVLFADVGSPSPSLAAGSLGAHFFLPRSADPGQFRLVCHQAIERTALLRERELLRAALASRTSAMWLPAGDERYQSVVTSLEAGILLHDADGVLRSWNESALRILGRDPDGGISFDPFRHPERFTRQDGTPFAAGDQPAARALQRGEPSTRVVMRVMARDDQIVWVEVNAQPMRDGQDGRIVGVVSSLTDITEHIRLREDEQRLRARLVAAATEWLRTFDSVDSPIAVVDAHGVIQRLNRAARDLIAEPFVDIIGKHLHEMPGEPFATAADLVRRGVAQSVPAFDARANRHWEVTLSVLSGTGEAGDPSGRRWVVSAREVTQLLDLQASLHRSRIMAAMGTLVAEVAHEVRNPLFALSAYLDVFEARFGAEPEYSRYVENFRAQIGRLRYLMQDLLDYSKGSPMERREPAHFEELVAEAVSAAEFVAQEREITIVQDSAPSLPRVQANAPRLVTAIHNLIQNAIQHSPAGGVVRVNTRLIVRGGKLVECSVSDSGPGFRDEDLPKIFLPFFSRRSGGTGLGLAIVQHIVESHDGTIEARNIPNGGAMISFRLPVERGA